MKKFLSILVAALVGVLLVMPASPASAAAQSRMSMRTTLSGCTLTVHVSWGGVTWATPTTPVGGHIGVGSGGYGAAAFEFSALKKTGRTTAVFIGTENADSSVTTVQADLSGVPVEEFPVETLATTCAGWHLATTS